MTDQDRPLAEADYPAMLPARMARYADQATSALPQEARDAGMRFEWVSSTPDGPAAEAIRREFLAIPQREAAHARWPPLPWRTRLRLAVTRRIDGAGCWLVEHDRFGTARALWRMTGMWRRS